MWPICGRGHRDRLVGVAAQLVNRVGVKPIIALGMTLLTVGLLYFTQVSVGGTYAGDLLPGFLIIAAGLGFSFVPISIAALAGVQSSEAGLASGLFNTSQQIGARSASRRSRRSRPRRPATASPAALPCRRRSPTASRPRSSGAPSSLRSESSSRSCSSGAKTRAAGRGGSPRGGPRGRPRGFEVGVGAHRGRPRPGRPR